MASEPVINHGDFPTAARDIYREYGGPAIMLTMADEIERLQAAIKVMHPGFCVEEAILLFGTPTQAEPK